MRPMKTSPSSDCAFNDSGLRQVGEASYAFEIVRGDALADGLCRIGGRLVGRTIHLERETSRGKAAFAVQLAVVKVKKMKSCQFCDVA